MVPGPETGQSLMSDFKEERVRTALPEFCGTNLEGLRTTPRSSRRSILASPSGKGRISKQQTEQLPMSSTRKSASSECSKTRAADGGMRGSTSDASVAVRQPNHRFRRKLSSIGTTRNGGYPRYFHQRSRLPCTRHSSARRPWKRRIECSSIVRLERSRVSNRDRRGSPVFRENWSLLSISHTGADSGSDHEGDGGWIGPIPAELGEMGFHHVRNQSQAEPAVHI
jgi:hypothetical protein